MRLLHRAEALSLRLALALPPRVQRLLAGRPLVRDGQTLAAETQLMLRLMALSRQPDLASLPIPQGRALLRRQATAAGGRQPIGSVADLSVADLPARLYVPTSADPVGPLLVFFHGGGWIYGDLDAYDPVCRFLAERAGVRVLSVDYRLAPEHPFPAAYDDCVAAYRWVVEHAAELGADPTRLGVGGDSAGGCLAATTAIAAAQAGLPCRFQLLVYPGTDMRGDTESRRAFNHGLVLTQEFMDLAKASYLPQPDDVTDPRASPMLAELPDGLAPALVVTAGFDPLRDEGEAYARKLTDAGVPVELARVPDQVHGFFNLVGVGHSARAANRRIAADLAAGLGSPVSVPGSA